jgi:hypothetical protein
VVGFQRFGESDAECRGCLQPEAAGRERGRLEAAGPVHQRIMVQRYTNPGAEGIHLLELAKNARKMFKMQPLKEKRRLLQFAISNSTWKDGQLTVTYRQPFDLFATWSGEMKKSPVSEWGEKGQNEKWLPFLNSYRTLCLDPPPSRQAILGDLKLIAQEQPPCSR